MSTHTPEGAGTGSPGGVPRLQAVGVSKRFGPVVANDAVDLDLYAGRVHALVGENGAGKSTLMSILYGSARPDTGTVVSRSSPVRFGSPREAIADGVCMVHQHVQLFESMTVTENVVYGAEPTRAGFLDRGAATDRVAELLATYGSPLAVDARVGDLPMGLRQQVEIVKALYRGADVLVLDEPTAVLTPGETELLFTSLARLADRGVAIVLVTHKLDEVLRVGDHVTVMRRGRVVESVPTAGVTAGDLALAMTGRSIEHVTNTIAAVPGLPVLELDDVRIPADGSRTDVEIEQLSVRAGEIVGVAGVAGNGQGELVQAIAGLRPATGAVSVCGVRVERQDVAGRRAAGLAFVPEDRCGTAIAPTLSIADNLAAGHLRGDRVAGRFGWLSPDRVGAFATDLVARRDVRGAGPQSPVAALSGGNAQKVVLARELDHGADLLVVENPTQGVDVGAIEEIHAALLEYRDQGRGVLLVSNELSELCALADRVYVMVGGRVVARLPRAEMTEQSIGAVMTNAAVATGVAATTALVVPTDVA